MVWNGEMICPEGDTSQLNKLETESVDHRSLVSGQMHLPFHIPFLKTASLRKHSWKKNHVTPWKSGAFKNNSRTVRVLRVSGMLDSLSMLARCLSSSGLTLIWSLLFLLVIQLIAAMMVTQMNRGFGFGGLIRCWELTTVTTGLTLDEPHIWFISMYIHFLKLVFTTLHASLYTIFTHLSRVFLNCFNSHGISDKAALGTGTELDHNVEELADFDVNYPPWN